jgi:hypothetical protein
MSTLRMPQHLADRPQVDTGEAHMRFELLEDIDSGLRRAEQRVAETLADLRDHDREGGDPQVRTALVDLAADAVWALVVQHEACDCADHQSLIERYRIPAEVMARIGARH